MEQACDERVEALLSQGNVSGNSSRVGEIGTKLKQTEVESGSK